MFKNTYSPVALTQFEKSVNSTCSSKKNAGFFFFFFVDLFVKQGLRPHWLDLEPSRWSRMTLNHQPPNKSCGYKLAPSLLFMRCWGSSPGLPRGEARTLLTELQLPGPSLTIVETTNNATLEDMGMARTESLPHLQYPPPPPPHR